MVSRETQAEILILSLSSLVTFWSSDLQFLSLGSSLVKMGVTLTYCENFQEKEYKLLSIKSGMR